MRRHDNLVITRAGASSLHRQWLQPREARTFDVLLTSFDSAGSSEQEPGVDYVFLPGKKVEGWRAIVTTLEHKLRGYKRIAFLDDDLSWTAAEIARCFELGQRYDLDLWQPSLTWDSYFTFGGTLHNPHFLLRYVNYVEMMCPFMTMPVLERIKETFFLGLESGIDLVWCSLVPGPERRCAIVDAVQVKHTRPVGRDKEANGFVHRLYEDDIHACLGLFHMPWPSLVADRAILRDGRPVTRNAISPRVLRILGALPVTPDTRGLKQVMDHIRHQMMRPQLYNEKAPAILSDLAKECRHVAT
jgi:hypothetical protein